MSSPRTSCTLHTLYGWTTGVLTNEYLPISGPIFFPILHHSRAHLDQVQVWMPEADPGEATVSYCALQRSPQGSCGDLFFHSMIHLQFLLGFISGARLLLCPLLHWGLGHLMDFWCKTLSYWVILKCSVHQSLILSLASVPRRCLNLAEFWMLI